METCFSHRKKNYFLCNFVVCNWFFRFGHYSRVRWFARLATQMPGIRWLDAKEKRRKTQGGRNGEHRTKYIDNLERTGDSDSTHSNPQSSTEMQRQACNAAAREAKGRIADDAQELVTLILPRLLLRAPIRRKKGSTECAQDTCGGDGRNCTNES